MKVMFIDIGLSLLWFSTVASQPVFKSTIQTSLFVFSPNTPNISTLLNMSTVRMALHVWLKVVNVDIMNKRK